MVELPKGFVIQELVPPEVFDVRGGQSVWCLCPNALRVLGQLRSDYGPITVNNWHRGGKFKYRGFRPADCGVGATWSQHRYGRGFDCSFAEAEVDIVRREVMEKARASHPVYSLIGGIEEDVDWFHFDTRPTDRLMVFKP